MKIKCCLAGEIRWISVAVLLCVTLLLCTISTVQNTPAPKKVSAELHEKAVLLVNMNQICDLVKTEWRKHYIGNTRHLLVLQTSNKTTYYGNASKYELNNQSLVLHKLQKEDEGIYEVSLICKNGTVQSQFITLSVISPPKIHFTSNGSKWSLKCEYNLTEEVSQRRPYKWLQNGQSLTQDSRYSLSDGNMTLLLDNVTVEDCGAYSCVVTSYTTEKVAHIHLTGETMQLCTELTASTAVLSHRDIALTTAAAIFAILVVVFVCFAKNHPGCCREGQTAQHDEDSHVYEEPRNNKSPPIPQEESRSVCIYEVDASQSSANSRSYREPNNDEIYSYIGLPQ